VAKIVSGKQSKRKNGTIKAIVLEKIFLPETKNE